MLVIVSTNVMYEREIRHLEIRVCSERVRTGADTPPHAPACSHLGARRAARGLALGRVHGRVWARRARTTWWRAHLIRFYGRRPSETGRLHTCICHPPLVLPYGFIPRARKRTRQV